MILLNQTEGYKNNKLIWNKISIKYRLLKNNKTCLLFKENKIYI